MNGYEKHSLGGRKKIKPFPAFLENGSEKILEQSAVEHNYIQAFRLTGLL